ncbi:unnamed protein product [Withania somnifera]
MAIITNRYKSFILLLHLCISINFLASEARPLYMLKAQSSGGAFDWINMGAIKNGLSLGSGHKFNSQIYLGIKNSGPSPGEGHKVTTGNHQ